MPITLRRPKSLGSRSPRAPTWKIASRVFPGIFHASRRNHSRALLPKASSALILGVRGVGATQWLLNREVSGDLQRTLEPKLDAIATKPSFILASTSSGIFNGASGETRTGA